MDYLSRSEKDTIAIAKEVARTMAPGDILALVGNLGAGKTTLAKGIGSALGVTREITSPTFVVMKQYLIDKPRILSNNHFFIHVDCYRIHTREDAESVGLIDILNNNTRDFVIIEWPENITEILPKNVKKVSIEYLDERTRNIKIE